MTPASAKIPVTVIGGFLGAGKTTFVNHLLATGTARTAVLVNDFGEVNVDMSLIASHDGDTMTLTNGCICCSIGTSFIDTMCRVLDAPVPYERIVIEASGVGDPWKIAEIALIEPALRLDQVIVIADGSRIVQLAGDARVGDTVRSQFDRCDIVLLNKIDLVDADGLAAARAAVQGLRPELRIVETARGAMPALAQLETGPSLSGFRVDSPSLDGTDHGAQFSSWCYRRDGAFDRAALADALADMPPQLLRLKGSCRLSGQDGRTIFQMVEKVWSVSPDTVDDIDHGSDIVLVGVGTADLPAAAMLDAILDRALVVEPVLSFTPYPAET
ncbi:CobW family GTP-binding protein [Bradyrhizobium japonicum]|uniref:CobW family GTP-binding protein n=1 Tax=Bradyrhizobium japonicum TaxID=375 RepID=UPI0003FAFDC2|nr:GTP-binding protein [Bradyrhizobium japonicum]